MHTKNLAPAGAALAFVLSVWAVMASPAPQPFRAANRLAAPPATAVVSHTGFAHFKVTVSQSGIPRPVKSDTVELDRKPFALEIETRKPCSLWVNASFDPALFNVARLGKPMGRIFTPSHIGADHNFNPRKHILVSPALPARLDGYWKILHNNFYVNSKRDHRCDRVRIYRDGCYCRRTVANLWENRNTTPVSQTRRTFLYLVFFRARCDAGQIRCTEQKRGGLTLKFR